MPFQHQDNYRMKTALCFLELNSHEGKQPSALHLCEAGNLKPQTQLKAKF